MSLVVLSSAAHTALAAYTPRTQAYAQAFVALLPAGGSLVLSRLGVTLRTITVGAWTLGTQRVDGRWPLRPGAFTDAGTGAGVPDTAVFKDHLGVEHVRVPAGVGTGVFQLLNELVDGEVLSLDSFVLTSLGVPPDNPTPPSGKVWAPGHYMWVCEDIDYTGMDEGRRSLVKNNPNWVGYQLAYLWANHESSKGNFDFSLMLADLDKAHADGKKAIIRIIDRRFTSDRPFPVPQYIVDDYNGTWSSGSKVWLKTWVPEVRDRLFQYVEAMLAAVRDHPAFQGAFTEESSMGSDPDFVNVQPGYTYAQEAAYFLEYSQRGSAAVGDGIFMMNMNWGYGSNPGAGNPSREQILTTMCETHKSGLGASDARIAGDSNGGATGYKFQPWAHAGHTSLAAGIEYNTYANTGRTAKDYLDHAVDVLHLTHMHWMPRTSTSGVSFNIYDAIEEVDRQNGRINTARPTNFPAG